MTPHFISDLMARAYYWQRPWSAKAVTDTLAQPTTRLWTTDHAILLMQVVENQAEVLGMATDPQMQRQGLAKRLLSNAHADLQAEGITHIILEVAAPNFPARALYNALGYAQAGTRPAYYKSVDGVVADAIIMTCYLPKDDKF